MEIIIVQLLLSLFGFGLQAANYVDAHKPVSNTFPCEAGIVSVGAQHAVPLLQSGEYELNDVPGNVTLQIDGYEIAYPIRTEILGASGLNPTTNPHPHLNPPLEGEEVFNSPPDKEGWPKAGVVGMPRYYILAEPIMFRRAGDSEWRSFYKAYPPSTPMTTDENIQAGESVPSVTSVDNILSSKNKETDP